MPSGKISPRKNHYFWKSRFEDINESIIGLPPLLHWRWGATRTLEHICKRKLNLHGNITTILKRDSTFEIPIWVYAGWKSYIHDDHAFPLKTRKNSGCKRLSDTFSQPISIWKKPKLKHVASQKTMQMKQATNQKLSKIVATSCIELPYHLLTHKKKEKRTT